MGQGREEDLPTAGSGGKNELVVAFTRLQTFKHLPGIQKLSQVQQLFYWKLITSICCQLMLSFHPTLRCTSIRYSTAQFMINDGKNENDIPNVNRSCGRDLIGLVLTHGALEAVISDR